MDAREMEWVSRAWAGAGQPHLVEDIDQVEEEACTLAVVASAPYLGKQTLVGHWEVAYQADNALVACMVQAYRLRVGQEGASPAS